MNIDKHAVHLYGTNWCNDCKRSKQFLGEQRIPYHYINIDKDEKGLRYVEEHNNGKRIIPTIVFDDGDIFVEPSNAELAAKLGLQTEAKSDFYDLVIVGGGPAGLAAAVYAGREGIKTLLIEKGGLGGQAGVTDRIDNYLGFAEGIGGADFATAATEQVRRLGTEFLLAREVESIGVDDPYRVVTLDGGDTVRARTLLLASGASYRRLGVAGEEELIGSGVHFCATCDGPFYRDQHVAVIGGGNSALEESLFLRRFVSKVTILVRGDKFKASQALIDKIMADPDIEVVWNTEVTAFVGENELEALEITNNNTGEGGQITPDGVFVFIGLDPNTRFIGDVVNLTPFGFIVTGHELTHRLEAMEGKRDPLMMESSVPGIFAAGDVRLDSTKQIASAVGDGAAAALAIREYLKTV